MSGTNRTASGPHRFEGLDCPVEAGEECVMPQRRTWGWDRSINPVYIGLLATLVVSLLLWAGGPGGVNAHFSQLDQVVVQQAKDDVTLDKKVDNNKQELETRLKSIDDKLDRLIERRR